MRINQRRSLVYPETLPEKLRLSKQVGGFLARLLQALAHGGVWHGSCGPAHLEEIGAMEYRLEVYRSGHFGDGSCIKVFTSTAPFMSFRVGDLLDATSLGEAASASKLLRVLGVEHSISEKATFGIDPSGSIIHRMLIYTERILDTDQTRHEAQIGA
jgi:hypothetical protein